MCQYLGIFREKIIGTNLFPYIYENDREFVKRNILSLDREHPFLTHEQRVLDQNGNIRWQQWTNRAIFDESGDIVEYQGVGQDITERKIAEENLLVMNMAIASSINGIAIATLDGLITYANTAFLTIFGVPRLEDILHKPLEMLANPKNPGPGVKVVMQALKERGEWVGEILIIRKDGTQVHTHHTANLIRDKNGVPIAMMASFIDISEKVENEREMKIKNTAIESAINGIIIFDAEDRLVYANQAFLSIFGAKSLDGMLQNYMDDFWKIANNTIPPVDEIKKVLSAQGRWSGELRVKMPGGMSRFFQVSATQVKDDRGALLCGMGTFMDITDQKVIEKALKTTHEKLQDAVEFMPDPTFIINRDKKVIAWNRALETLSGVKSADILGTDTYKKAFSFLEGTRPILVDILDLPAHELAKSYPNIRRFGDSIFVEAFISGRQKEGGIYLWGKATPLFDREGNTIGAIESFRDMSEWKKAKETTQIHQEREGDLTAPLPPPACEHRNNLDCLESAFDQLPDGVAILDTQARIQKMNPPFLALLQCKKDEVIGKEFFQVCNSRDVPLVRECLCQSRDNGKRTDTVRIRVGELNQVTDAEISCLRDAEGAFLGHLVVMRNASQDLLQR
jgi:PAS domain S-box-containing protein